MLKIDDFSPVTLEDRDFFLDLFAQYPQQHSDMSFTTMMCWNHYAHYEWAETDGGVVIMSTIENNRTFRGPIGPRSPDALEEVLDLAAREGCDAPYYVFDEATLAWIRSLYPGLRFVSDRDFADYVYLASELEELPGKHFLTIRKHLNRFRRECDPAVEAMDNGNLGEVREFLEKWCEWRHCDESPVLAREKEAVIYAMNHFEDLNLSGLLIRAGETIRGISIYDALNTDTALVHFEKGLPDCEGVYKAVNQEAAHRLSAQYIYINRESDVGVPGLREAKLRYHPHHMAKVYIAKKDELLNRQRGRKQNG
ncbi:DUF2156 domain-containing protein [Methanofollis fontis]|uniref:Phosphatidylglycerol lysyltransferase C-terminal domain-containing protein n=1 Tax=Methanofollis fontis TaxID=2052832 RepID=A0A483CSQ8_9EURY|nr:phosphatidylglycerol lysyltransferase domain-containing protein [Methanofollis fontis]TAJ44135.1 hypothetical protein CUJ86_08895 [Methanofollis fontis]